MHSYSHAHGRTVEASREHRGGAWAEDGVIATISGLATLFAALLRGRIVACRRPSDDIFSKS